MPTQFLAQNLDREALRKTLQVDPDADAPPPPEATGWTCDDGCEIDDLDDVTHGQFIDMADNDSTLDVDEAKQWIDNNQFEGYQCPHCGETFEGTPSENERSGGDEPVRPRCPEPGCSESFRVLCQALTHHRYGLGVAGLIRAYLNNRNRVTWATNLGSNAHDWETCFCERAGGESCPHRWCVKCGHSTGSEEAKKPCITSVSVLAYIYRQMIDPEGSTNTWCAEFRSVVKEVIGIDVKDLVPAQRGGNQPDQNCPLCMHSDSCCPTHRVHKEGHDRFSCFEEMALT